MYTAHTPALSIGNALALPTRTGGDGDGDTGGADAAQAAADAKTAQDAANTAAQAAADEATAAEAAASGDGSADDSETRKLKRENQRLRGERNKLADAAEANRVAKLSETEQAKEAADTAKAEAAAAKAEVATLRIESAVTTEASKLKFFDPADALALLPPDAITIADDGTVTGTADALKALAEAKPHLVNRSGGDAGGAFGSTSGRQGDANAETDADRRVRLGLQRPGVGQRIAFNGGGVVSGKPK